MRLTWTDEQIDILKKYYPDHPIDTVLEKLPGIELHQIRSKASQLKIRRVKRERSSNNNKKHLRWSKEEKEKLKQVYSHTSNSELIKMFEKFDIRRIRYQARRLGLEKLPEIAEIDKQNIVDNMLGERAWTEEEEKILEDNYELMGINVQKLLPQKTKSAINSKASNMGLSTSMEAKWKMTDISVNSEDMFSINIEFERMDR